MLLKKNNNNNNNNKKALKGTGNRILINVTVVGSAGPLRFVVDVGENVADVIDTALKAYAREGRLPVLGSNCSDFVLYCPVVGTEALKPWEPIGSVGVRNFMLCKKPREAVMDGDDGRPTTTGMPRKSVGGWKAWFNKSLNLKVSSH